MLSCHRNSVSGQPCFPTVCVTVVLLCDLVAWKCNQTPALLVWCCILHAATSVIVCQQDAGVLMKPLSEYLRERERENERERERIVDPPSNL